MMMVLFLFLIPQLLDVFILYNYLQNWKYLHKKRLKYRTQAKTYQINPYNLPCRNIPNHILSITSSKCLSRIQNPLRRVPGQ